MSAVAYCSAELSPLSVLGACRPTTDPTAPKLTIPHTRSGGVMIPDVTLSPITDAGDVETIMAKAARSKAVAATQMNAQSSRSHCVFTLNIVGRNATRGVEVKGALNLCDLAGSERLSRSQAEGVQLKEAQAINKSLSCLVDVFTSLQKKASHVRAWRCAVLCCAELCGAVRCCAGVGYACPHPPHLSLLLLLLQIPFRNSKLTDLLQPCFSGDGKVLMIVNLSPTMASAGESLCSLRFAQQASQIEMGKPTRKVVDISSSTTAAASGSGEGDEDNDVDTGDAEDVAMDGEDAPVAPIVPKAASIKAAAASSKPAGAKPPAPPTSGAAAKRPLLKK